MNIPATSLSKTFRTAPGGPRAQRACAVAVMLGCAVSGLTASRGAHAAPTSLADQPVFSNITVPGNLALALSVEFPTAISVAHTGNYSAASEFLGYFDPNKCYTYHANALLESDRYFQPAGAATAHACVSKWSGNFLNWATMQTVDPFRGVLTGGFRSRDDTTMTLLERAWASPQGSTSNFPDRSLTTASVISGATPLPWASLNMRNWSMGNKLVFSFNAGLNGVASATVNAAQTPLPIAGVTVYDPAVALSTALLYELTVRVRVCDSNVGSAGPLESNCTRYSATNYKPTGLMQKYSEKIRYSAFGYLNDDNLARDGGVLRAKQKFIGPLMSVPGQAPQASTDGPEWDASTGVMTANPNPTDAAAFGVAVSNSGVMNYLNKFGEIKRGSYKTYDPVSELYYAAIRYYKNQGNVSAWSAGSGNAGTNATYADGFPVITNWGNPIQYSCQKNFILGIGDVNTHADKNLPGPTGSANEPTKPSEVVADTTVDAVRRTNQVGTLHGLGGSLGTTYPYNGCCTNNSALMAGLAYDANTKDILGRPETGTFKKQTIKTYWLDVLEYQNFAANNQFYLAAKYGGFKVPDGFDPDTRSTDIDSAWWTTTGETVPNGAPRPDNYFTAARPDQVKAGLTRVFDSISDGLGAFTTSFGTALPQVAISGSSSYSAKYDAQTWSGEVEASSVIFNAATGAPALTSVWLFSSKLATQAAATGWNTDRRIATWNGSAGVAFRIGNLSTTQKAALDTAFRSGDDSADFLNYLRGDRTNEKVSDVDSTAQKYRYRSRLLGDIVGSKVRAVGPPSSPYSDASNPGYSTFKTTYATRPTMVYVGSNDGMLHAINGSLTGSDAGKEVFAYVPSALYSGPTATPDVNGLQSRANPSFTHKPLVDGTPAVFDIDFGRTGGTVGAVDWHTVLVGALGKGGKSYYAIDVTNPAAMTTEATVAGKVLWEFTDTDLGYTYGEPTAVKTKKWGWVLLFGSGYNNTGAGYFYLVNPKTGALLEKISTGTGTSANPAGMAHAQGFVPDRTDYTADSAYAGDLLGNLWRLDLTPGPGLPYTAPVQLATLTNAAGTALPITSRPLAVVHPVLNRRFVTVGSGKLLDNSDLVSSTPQVFVAVLDGNNNGFNTKPLPTGVTYPIQRTNLVQLTDLTQKTIIDFDTKMGWWIDLDTTAGAAWRVISEPSSFFGVVTFAAMVPNGDTCNPSGTSRVFSVDVGSGQSQLLNDAGDVVAYQQVAGVVTEHKTYSVNGVPRLIISTDSGGILPLKRPPLTNVLRRLNWRELPLAD